ncbi:MAG: Do family serine endopeptidase [Candidatus Omnitrophota bacterium]
MFQASRKNFVVLLVLLLTVGITAGLLIAARLDITPKTSAVQGDSQTVAKTALEFETAFSNVAGKVGPAVVSISTEQTARFGGAPRIRRYYFRGSPFGRDFDEDFFERFFDDFFGEMPQREFKQRGLGSGVIIDKDGHILTNEHVVRSADKITVTLPDGREFNGVVRGTDPRSDLAVIKIKAENLPFAKLGNSDNLKIGQWVVAIGNPFGYLIHNPEPTVTVGVVSALHRSLTGLMMFGERDYSDLIQTDAAINPGNSGGPLVNLYGEVAGINVAIFSTSGGYQGIGFAIPSNAAKKILSRLIEGKKITYGWLGVSVQDIDDKLAGYFKLSNKEGALVVDVIKGGPAETAGLKNGDIIIAFEGKAIKEVRELVKLASGAEVGTKVSLKIIRDGKTRDIFAVIGERPEKLAEEIPTPAPRVSGQETFRGMRVESLSEEMAEQLGVEEQQGVVVTDVEPESLAAAAGLRLGDVISQIDKSPVKNLDDFQAAITKVKGDCLLKTGRGYVVLAEK